MSGEPAIAGADTLNRASVWALVLGILGLFTYVPAFFAIWASRRATRQIAEFRRTDGRGIGLARAGAFLGYLAITFWTFAWMVFFISIE